MADIETDLDKSTLWIITGYSGAGKSIVLKAFEDLGFFCVDNLPVMLLDEFFTLSSQKRLPMTRVALGIDIRIGKELDVLVNKIANWKAQSFATVHIIFLTASTAILVKRFQETRRRHPLVDPLDITDAIEQEKKLLQPLKEQATLVVDTDQFTIHELRNVIRTFLSEDAQPYLVVTAVSFGFKYGVPPESNFVYDIRSLPNPYFVPELKSLDGTNPKIKSYLFSQPEVREYWQHLHTFLEYSLKKSYAEGRYFLTVAIGCTGGRHRSVAFVEELASLEFNRVKFLIKHRDIYKDIAQ